MLNVMCQKCCSKMRADICLLITRLIVGGIFIYSGWMKVSDMEATIGFFGQLGIPSFLAYVVGYLELIGGVMIVLGFWTCLAAVVLAVIMVFAIWFSRSQGFEFPLATLAALLALVGVCGGKYSLKCPCGSGCGSGAGSQGGVCEDCKKDGDVSSSAN